MRILSPSELENIWQSSRSDRLNTTKLIAEAQAKETLKEVADYLEEHPGDMNYNERWLFLSRLRTGLLP